MNQKLQSLFATELKELRREGIVGEAVERYLLDGQNNIKIPNIIYCVLQMLGTEYENPNLMYNEYRGGCLLPDCEEDCPTLAISEGGGRWYFWYLQQEDILNITGEPVNSLGDADCSGVDRGENDILFNLYAKLAYQCMIIYEPRYKCYLPPNLWRMARYILFAFSYKAFHAALESAVNHDNDEDTNYVIREALATMLGLGKVNVDKIYSEISSMQGEEKAAVCRVIASWDLDDDLQKKIKEIADEFIRMLSHSRVRKLTEEHEREMKQVLGEELFCQVQKHFQRNNSII